MFDVKKIQRMETELKQFAKVYDNVYIVPEVFRIDAAALFKRLQIPVRAVMHDQSTEKEVWDIPVIKTKEATANFNERTALIILTTKPVPFIQTTFDFKVRGGTWTIPALCISYDEAVALYDRLMVDKLIQMYKEDKITEVTNISTKVGERFSRGFTTMLDLRFQDFKFQAYDRQMIFKPTYNFNDTAIVIQGPIAYDNDYTVETFKLYRSIYPNVPIIVSTWQGEATNDFRKECRDNLIVLLENEPPKERGAFNVNMQLKSSIQGVKFVRENTCAKFVLKTRTDQRINRFDFLVYFKNLLATFPPKDDKLNQRIIFLSEPMLNQFPFYYQDYLSFGHVEDIAKLYSIPFHSEPGEMSYTSAHYERMRKFVDKVLNISHSVDYNSEFAQNPNLCKLKRLARKFCFPEMYISKTFYKQYIAPIDENKLPETSWKFAADYLILIDFETILIDWFKYEHKRYLANYNIGHQSAFSRWLDIYRNFKWQ